MDESHYQSLDEEKRRYSDGEQGKERVRGEVFPRFLVFEESMSSVSSSRSSGSGAASPPNLHR